MSLREPEDLERLCATATALSRALERELARLQARNGSLSIKEVYDVVYLPRLAGLGREANRFVKHPDWQVLCVPLYPDLAGTHIRIVIEMLDLIMDIV